MTIILAVIAVYMLSMLCIGYRAKKSVKSSADFFIGGSRFGAALTAIAHQAAGLPFDLSIRMRLVDKIIAECKKMGRTVVVKYY